ncbi:E3 binding domain-containing protein [Larsenimonas rhizosphaerae]|uniref:E3 binding domain-containing protein n=1 Tax=Larsenimonas rhizosphaerae TaxID=2944682 RepID=UPI0033139349
MSTITHTPKIPHAAPSARKLARELGVPLSCIAGSGRHNRILTSDIKGFVNARLHPLLKQ